MVTLGEVSVFRPESFKPASFKPISWVGVVDHQPIIPQFSGADPDLKEYRRKKKERREDLEEVIDRFEGKIKSVVTDNPEAPIIQAAAKEIIREARQELDTDELERIIHMTIGQISKELIDIEVRRRRRRNEAVMLLF